MHVNKHEQSHQQRNHPPCTCMAVAPCCSLYLHAHPVPFPGLYSACWTTRLAKGCPTFLMPRSHPSIAHNPLRTALAAAHRTRLC